VLLLHAGQAALSIGAAVVSMQAELEVLHAAGCFVTAIDY
jgi:hypothetical protein